MSSGPNWGGPSGFSLLLWEDDPQIDLECKETLLDPQDEQDLNPTTVPISGDQSLHLPELLEDAKILLLGRWGVHIEEKFFRNQWYLWAVCTRFNVSDETVRRALGDLTNILSFQKGAATQDFETAVKYKLCREKWGVPQTITEKQDRTLDSFGVGGNAPKRQRL